MADTKISGLTAATGAVTNEIPVNEGAVSKKLTVSQILALAYPVTPAASSLASVTGAFKAAVRRPVVSISIT